MNEISRDQLIAGFRDIGLSTGDSLIVHSSYRSIRPIAGGPMAVIETLLDVIGDRGNLMFPTFNYTHPLPQPHYDPDVTPARTGIIAELGRQHTDAVRSLNPTHSVAVIGPDARALTEGHLETRAFGTDSPIDRLAKMKGKIVLIGVGQVANSTIHVAEEYAGIPKASPYDGPLPVVRIRHRDGRFIDHTLDTSPSCSAGFEAVAWTPRVRGEIRDGRVGDGLLQSMSGQAVIDRTVDLLHGHSTVLLCTNPRCLLCGQVRQRLQK